MALETLNSIYKLRSFANTSDVYYRVDKTPAHEFLYLYSILGDDSILEVDVRDYNKSSALLSFIKTAKKNYMGEKESLVKKSGFEFDDLTFNAILFVPGIFVLDGSEPDEDALLIKETILSFPIYDCEFTGLETKEEFQLLRRDFVVTIDWQRKPSPIVKMKFNNLKTGVKSIGKKRGYTSISSMLIEIDEIRDEKSFIELENYRSELIIITYIKRKLLVKDSKANVLHEGSAKETKLFIQSFLINGL